MLQEHNIIISKVPPPTSQAEETNTFFLIRLQWKLNTRRANKNNQADTICDYWQYLHNILKPKGKDKNIYIIDNE